METQSIPGNNPGETGVQFNAGQPVNPLATPIYPTTSAPTTPTGGVTGVESPENPTGGLVESPAQTAERLAGFPGMPQEPTPINPVSPAPTTPVNPPPTPVDNTKAIADTQAKISDLQSQADALRKYGITDTNQLTKDANGNYIPVAQPKPEVNVPNGIETATQKGLIDFYNQDKNAFTDWAKSQSTPWSDTQILDIAQKAEAQKLEDTRNEANKKIQEALAGTLTADQQASLDALQRQWDATVDSQKIANQTYTNEAMTIAALQGRIKYNMTNVIGEVKQAIQTGIDRVAQFQAAGQAAVANMRAAFEQQNFNNVTKAYEQIISNDKAISDEIDKMYNTAYQAQKDAQAQIDKIAENTYNRTTKPIEDTLATVIANNAPQSIRDAVKNSTTVEEAISNAGLYLSNATGDIGDYNMYLRDKQQAGLTPLGYQDWKDKQDAKETALESSRAYASAYASAMGKNAANNVSGLDANGNPIIAEPENPDAKEILGQTGLSKLTFDYLTTGTKALTRLTATERLKTISDAGEWLRSHGVDSSTFISQYDAYNKTLENNIKRVNQVKVSEGELKGTLENLAVAADESSFDSMKIGNVAKLFAGQEFNDPNVSKYAFHLTQLRQEFAMYNAAAGGKINNDGSVRTDDGDIKEAERVIKTGLAEGGIEGFQNALNASVAKMDTVLNASLNTSRQNVWKLFGVGQNFKPTYDTPEQFINTNPANEQKWIEATNLLKSHPEIVGPNPTAEDVFQYVTQ